MASNQSDIEYGYMILTSGRDDEVLVIWTSFVFFRPILVDCINISKFKNTDTSRCECIGWRDICFSLENISSFYYFHFILRRNNNLSDANSVED